MAAGGSEPLPGEETEDDDSWDEYEEKTPGYLNNMFGSLFGVAKTPPAVRQRLTDYWYRIVKRWYPNFHQKVYCSPPIHFNAVSFKPKPPKPKVRPEPYARLGFRLYAPVKYSSVKSDESQQRMLGTLSAFARKKGLVPQFLVSNMEFQHYLSRDYDWANPKQKLGMTVPNISLKNEEGEIDILIIDKVHGIVVLEVKAIGDLVEIWDMTSADDETKFAELHEKFKKKIGVQVEKGKLVIRKLLSDFDGVQKINVRGGFALVNVKRDFLERALTAYDKKLKEELLKRVDVEDIETLSSITLCSDDLPAKFTAGEEVMTEEIFRSIDKVWNNLLKTDGGGEDKPLSDDLYEQVVARFCGPLTTVKIYTEKTYPRVKLEIIPKKKKGKKGKHEAKVKMITEQAMTKAGAARIMARRFSELVLLQDQIELLQRNDDFVHIEGPPGTGKTLLLLLRILTWLEDGHMVWILSLSPPSRSVSHVLMEQVKKMMYLHKSSGTAEMILQRLRMFMMIRPENTLDKEYFKRRLLKFRLRAMRDPSKMEEEGYPRKTSTPSVTPDHDRKVCLALDETGLAGRGIQDFFQWVSDLHKQNVFNGKDFSQGLSVWSASVERAGRPMYATEPDNMDKDNFGVIWDLKMPLRCPPSVQRALILVQPSLDQENICCFTEEMTLSHPARQTGTDNREIYAADGLPVFLIGHGSHKDCHRDIWYCYECGDELANYLQNVLHIGEEECDCPHQPVIYEFDKDTPKNCSTCKKLTKGSLPAADLPLKFNDVMIVATQQAFQFSVPIGKFALAMKKRNLKVAINTTREEGQAPLPDDDVILIVDVTSVTGLERAIIIIIPEVNDPPPLPDHYRGILYPEPLYFTKSKKKPRVELPKDVKKTIGEKMKEGKRSVTFNAVGEMEEDDADEDMETEERGDAQAVTDKGEVKTKHGVTEAQTEDVEGNKARDSASTSGAAASPGEPPESPAQAEDKNPAVTPEPEIPYTYNDSFSKSEITAALMTLSPQSRKDVFYIGSRAVCQMILVHLGKSTRKPDSPEACEQPMETD